MKSILLTNKHFIISGLLMIAAIIFVVINQVDNLSKFSTAIVALALLVPSIIFAGLGIYRPPGVPLRWASMTTLVIASVLLIFVASNLFTSLTKEDAIEENGIAKEADVLIVRLVVETGATLVTTDQALVDDLNSCGVQENYALQVLSPEQALAGLSAE